MSESSIKAGGRPEAAAAPLTASVATALSRCRVSTAGSPLAPRPLNSAFAAISNPLGDSLVLRIDLALAGKLDPSQINPVVQPLRGRRQVDRRRHVDPPIQISPSGRGQEGRLDVELFQAQAVGLAVHPGGEGRGIAE